jgi:linalool dehydratase/isomerase-like protein
MRSSRSPASWAVREAGYRRAVKRRDERTAYLRGLGATATTNGKARAVQVRPTQPSDPVQAGPELTPDRLALARFALDRALQPVAEFEGFDRIEQFQTSSVRYQVATAGYALASLQFGRTPAFHAYLSEAQRNLIAKWQERVCWAYWAKENLWGNFRYDPDPVPRDNIMLSGWLAYQIAGYVSNTGDTRYSQPGSITFDHPRGRRYEYDLHSLTAALVRNFAGSDFTLFPCEPNWIYALCNGYGVLPLPIHDRLYGTDYSEHVLPAFRRHYEQEFLSVDGRTIGIRSSMTGLSIPAMTSILSDTAVIWQLNPVFPDLTRGLWEIVRREWVDIPATGPVQLDLRGWDKIDTGNYSRSPATAYSAIGWAATEMGDTELAARLTEDVEATYEPIVEGGVKRYGRASALSNFALLAGQVANPGGHRQRVAHGMPDAWMRGPVLDDCRYPDVLVAQAVSDGDDLRLVLHPGAAAGRQALGIARLRPGVMYRLTGAVQDAVTATSQGTARFEVDLDGRREVRLVPAEEVSK